MNSRQLLPIAGLVAVIAGSTGCATQVVNTETQPAVIAGGRFEASGLASVPGSQGVLFVDNSQDSQAFWMELDAEGNQIGKAIAVPLDTTVVDPEGITTNGTHYFIVGSQSKRDTEGDGLIRFAFAETNHKVSGVERITGLKEWLSSQVPELQQHGEPLNIEGLAWDPAGKRLLLGLRTPVVDGQALVIPLDFIDPAGAFASANIRVGQTMRVPLGGAGIRGIEYDETTQAFQVIAGAETDNAFRLVEWNGRSGAGVREIASFPQSLKAEGVARVSLGGRSMRVVVFDSGRVTVLN